MLILSRRVGDQILISDNIIIHYLGFNHGNHNQVKIGISAPLDVTIWREEVYRRIMAQQATEEDEEINNGLLR